MDEHPRCNDDKPPYGSLGRTKHQKDGAPNVTRHNEAIAGKPRGDKLPEQNANNAQQCQSVARECLVPIHKCPLSCLEMIVQVNWQTWINPRNVRMLTHKNVLNARFLKETLSEKLQHTPLIDMRSIVVSDGQKKGFSDRMSSRSTSTFPFQRSVNSNLPTCTVGIVLDHDLAMRRL